MCLAIHVYIYPINIHLTIFSVHFTQKLKEQLEANQRGVMIDENGKEVMVHNARREIVEKIVEREVIKEVRAFLCTFPCTVPLCLPLSPIHSPAPFLCTFPSYLLLYLPFFSPPPLPLLCAFPLPSLGTFPSYLFH